MRCVERVVTLVPEEDEIGMRVDAFIARRFPWRSRDSAAALCERGDATIDGARVKKSKRLVLGDAVRITSSVPDAETEAARQIPLRILHEDDDLVVVDKPPGVAVHPASTCQTVNLLHRLELHYVDAGVTAEPSIVHRLDRNTSGVLAYAKRRELVAFYTGQFERRTVDKRYLALVHGVAPEQLLIETPLVVEDERPVKPGPDGKPSKTELSRVEQREGDHPLSLVELRPATGRKHQLRVHLADAGYPIVFDDLYGRVADLPRWPSRARVMLHAAELQLDHRDGQRLTFKAPLPRDMEEVRRLGYSLS